MSDITNRTTDTGQFANLLDSNRFEHLWRVSQAFAKSDLVPQHFKGKPENCFVGLQMALRCGVDPFVFLQGCYVIHGKPGIEAKLAIALANNSGVFNGPIRFELTGEGDKKQCRAYAELAAGGEVDATVSMQMAKAEGWTSKSGSKWSTLPDLMLQYRAASFLIRLYAPEALFGMQTKEELQDVGPKKPKVEVDSAPAKLIEAKPKAKAKPKAVEQTIVPAEFKLEPEEVSSSSGQK